MVAAAAGATAVLVALSSTFDWRQVNPASDVSNATAQPGGSLTIVTLAQGKLAGGASYRIFPAPTGSESEYLIHDGEVGADTSAIEGVISIQGMPDDTYSVIQISGPGGQDPDIIPKVIEISNSSSEFVTFGDVQASVSQNERSSDIDDIQSVLYSSKFECGTIRGNEGPLRPGHYDTDIGLFNKQTVPVQFIWSVATSEGSQDNGILRNLGPQSSLSIVCNDIRSLSRVDNNFTEGYVLIEVPLDPKLRALVSGGSAVLDSNVDDKLDLLEVQTFYTANALDELPHPVMVDKITFIIRSNSTVNGLPDSMIGTLLDVTLPSQLGEISDPQERIMDHISEKFGLTETEMAKITVEIRSVDIGVGTMIDDHAVSLFKVPPQPKTG